METKIAGFSLVELLVVLVLFSVIAIVATETVILSLRSSRKSDAVVAVKQNIDHTVEVMTRHIRNSQKVVESYTCDGRDYNNMWFYDQDGTRVQFSCDLGSGFIASNSATPVYNQGRISRWNEGSQVRLTSDDVQIMDCSFSCIGDGYPDPVLVNIEIEAKERKTTGAEGARATNTSSVYIRNY